MSDILKWLQDKANEEWEYEDGDYFLEAIKQFTRLRADLAAEREQKFRHMDNSTKLCNELIAIRAENERLREALKPLAAITLWTDKYPDGPLSVGDNQRYIDPQWIVRARAALESMTETPNVP